MVRDGQWVGGCCGRWFISVWGGLNVFGSWIIQSTGMVAVGPLVTLVDFWGIRVVKMSQVWVLGGWQVGGWYGPRFIIVDGRLDIFGSWGI